MVKDIPSLSSIIESYPWFTAARAILCCRIAECSGREAAIGQYRESLPYFPDAGYVAKKMSPAQDKDFSDVNVAAIVRQMIDERPRIIFAGQDFFSRSDYESAKLPQDAAIHKIAIVDSSRPSFETEKKNPALDGKEFWGKEEDGVDAMPDIVTETLAEIFAEQGYPEQAIKIYEKLSLHSPEKNAYFASLIEKLKE